MQNTVFRDWNKSPVQAAKTLKVKIVKKFLSVFRDWKVYSRGSRELCRENLCVPQRVHSLWYQMKVQIV